MSEYPIHIEVLPKVHLVRGKNRAGFPEANTLLIDDEILTLVDAGTSMENITRTMRDLGHELSDIERIILSHFHIDHKGYAAIIQRAADCEMICHPLAEKGVRTFQGMVDYYGMEGRKQYDVWRVFINTSFGHVLGEYNVTGTFEEGKAISCGETEILPIHLPGHTLDHTCFGINGYDTIFLVDIDLTSFGPWYGNEVSDIEDFRRSMERVIEMNPRTGISSHLIDPVTDDLEERLRAFTRVFDEREWRVLDNIESGVDTIETMSLKPTIYRRIPMELYRAFEVFMLEKHVELLKNRGEIVEENGHLKIERR